MTRLIGCNILVLLAVWIPGYAIWAKGILMLVWLVKFAWEMNTTSAGRRGVIYALTRNLSWGVQNIIVAAIYPAAKLLFMGVAFSLKAWIPMGLVGIGLCISAISAIVEICGELKEIRQQKNEEHKRIK